MQNTIKPSNIGLERYDRRATRWLKSHLLKKLDNFHIFHPIFIKIGTETHFYMLNNLKPSNMGFEHSDRRAVGWSKSHLLKILTNSNISQSISIKIGTEIHFCIQNNIKPSNIGFEHYDRRATDTGWLKSHLLKNLNNFHIFHPIFIKICAETHFCMLPQQPVVVIPILVVWLTNFSTKKTETISVNSFKLKNTVKLTLFSSQNSM